MFEEMGIKATVVDGENYINVKNFIAYLVDNVDAASAGLAASVEVTLLMDKIIEDSIDTFLDSL